MMGNELIFFILLFVLVTLIFKKEAVSDYLFENLDINIPSRMILSIAVILLAILMIFGILFDNTKEKYSGISESYNQMRPNAPTTKDTKDKPHRWFDIDFDSVFPW